MSNASCTDERLPRGIFSNALHFPLVSRDFAGISDEQKKKKDKTKKKPKKNQDHGEKIRSVRRVAIIIRLLFIKRPSEPTNFPKCYGAEQRDSLSIQNVQNGTIRFFFFKYLHRRSMLDCLSSARLYRMLNARSRPS